MASKKIVIEFLGDSKDLQNAMGDADSKGGKLSGTLGKLGKAAALGLGAGIAVGAVALVKMTQGAIEDEAAQKKLETQLKNSAGATDKQVASVEDWITAQGKALGVTDDELRPALSKLVTATGDVSEAQKLASLAMDVSAGSGKSLDSVATALMKAQNGQIAGLSKLGIETKNAAGETLTFEQVTKNMADTFGGQAATKAETLQGKMDRLKLILSEAGETIGSKLIPVLTNMADWFLNKGLPAIQDFGGWLKDKLGPIFETVQTVIAGVMGSVNSDVTGNLSAVQSIFESVVSIITSLWNTFGATIVDYAVKTFENFRQVIGGQLEIIKGIFQTFAALLQGDWSGVWDGLKTILHGAMEVIKGTIGQYLNIWSTLFDLGWTVIKGIVDAAWEGIKTLTTNAIAKVVDWVTGIPGKFTTALSDLLSTVRTLFGDAMDAGQTKVENIAGAVITWVGGIPGKITTALSTLLSTVRDLFDDAMTAGKTKVENIGGTIVGWIEGIPAKLLEKLADFKKAGEDLIGGFVSGMKGAAGLVSDIAGNVWDAVKGLLNDAIDKINAALEFTISLPGPDITINPTNIPHLAKGTNYFKGGMALVGEEGPELVNLPRGSRVTPHGESMGSLSGIAAGVAPTIVQLVVGGRVLEQILIQHTRDTGRPLQVTTLGTA